MFDISTFANATAGQERLMIRRSKKIGPAVRLYHCHERKPAERFTLETGEPEAAGNV
jgi:hypothetical protein